MRDETLIEPFHRNFGNRLAGCLETPCDQGSRAMPDKGAHLIGGDWWPAVRAEHMVRRLHKVGCGLGEGSVEIEDYGAIWHAFTGGLEPLWA